MRSRSRSRSRSLSGERERFLSSLTGDASRSFLSASSPAICGGEGQAEREWRGLGVPGEERRGLEELEAVQREPGRALKGCGDPGRE